MASIASASARERILFWLFQHLDANKTAGGIDIVRRSRLAPVANKTLLNITPTSDGEESREANNACGPGRVMEVELAIVQSGWPTDHAYGTSGKNQAFGPESSIDGAITWLLRRLPERPVDDPDYVYSDGVDDVAIAGDSRDPYVWRMEFGPIYWSTEGRDTGDVVARTVLTILYG